MVFWVAMCGWVPVCLRTCCLLQGYSVMWIWLACTRKSTWVVVVPNGQWIKAGDISSIVHFIITTKAIIVQPSIEHQTNTFWPHFSSTTLFTNVRSLSTSCNPMRRSCALPALKAIMTGTALTCKQCIGVF